MTRSPRVSPPGRGGSQSSKLVATPHLGAPGTDCSGARSHLVSPQGPGTDGRPHEACRPWPSLCEPEPGPPHGALNPDTRRAVRGPQCPGLPAGAELDPGDLRGVLTGLQAEPGPRLPETAPLSLSPPPARSRLLKMALGSLDSQVEVPTRPAGPGPPSVNREPETRDPKGGPWASGPRAPGSG